MKPICSGDQTWCTCYGNFEGLPLWTRAFFGLVSYSDPCLIRWHVPGELDKFAAVWWSISLVKSTSRRPCWLAFVSRGFSWGYPTLLGKMWTGIQRPPKFCGTNHWFWGKPSGVSEIIRVYRKRRRNGWSTLPWDSAISTDWIGKFNTRWLMLMGFLVCTIQKRGVSRKENF